MSPNIMTNLHGEYKKWIAGGVLLSLLPMGQAQAKVLEEVIVTAQKTSSSTQDTPIAITGMTGDALEKFGFQNANDISAQVPNMQVSGPYGDVQPIFAIRGVSMSDYSSNQASPIGVYTDEMYMGATYTHGMNFFDVERLEVLRGPQGTLYGKNTTGGAVNIVTRSARVGDEFAVNAKGGTGSYGLTSTELGIQDTVIDEVLALRLGYASTRHDGYFENELGGSNLSQLDFQGARLTAHWLATESTSVELKYTNSGNDALANASRNEPRGDLSRNPEQAQAIEASGVGTYPDKPNNGFIDNTGYSRPGNNLDYWEVQDDYTGALVVDNEQAILKIETVTDIYTFTSITSYSEADYRQKQNVDGGPDGLLHIRWAVETDAFSQDFRIAGNYDNGFSFISGLYYATEFQDMHNIYEIYETPPDTRVAATYPGAAGFYPYLLDFGGIDQKMITDKTSYALYSQFRFDATANLGFDFGIRYTLDKIDLDYLNVSRFDYDGNPIGTWVPGNETGVDEPFIAASFGPNGPLEADQLAAGLADGSITLEDLADANQAGYTHGPYTTESAPRQQAEEKEWTGKLGVDYRVNEDLMFYASYSKGYRAGNFNGGVYYEVRDFEDAYAEPEFIDAYELGFKSDLFEGSMRLNAALFYYDYTNQQFINVVGVSNFLENAGGSEIFGFESELTWAIGERLMVNFGLGLLDSEYTELTLSDTRTLNDPDDTVDLSGNSLISAPDVSANLSVDYDIIVAQSGYLSLNLNANYQSEQWYSAYNDKAGYDKIKQDAYTLVNGRLTWRSSDESYSVSLWGKNLTDQEYDGYAINLQAGFGFDYFQQGAPRTYGLEMTYRWQ